MTLTAFAGLPEWQSFSFRGSFRLIERIEGLRVCCQAYRKYKKEFKEGALPALPSVTNPDPASVLCVTLPFSYGGSVLGC